MQFSEHAGFKGDGRQPVATPDQWLFLLVAERGERQQRHARTVGCRDLQVAEALYRVALIVFCARDHVDQVGTVAHLSDGRSADHTVEDLRHVFRRQAELTHLVLRDINLQHFARLVPVIDDLADVRVGVEDGRQCHRLAAHLFDVRAADPVLHRPAHWRSHVQWLDVAAHPDIIVTKALAQTLDQAITRCAALADDHQLPIKGIAQLLVQWQVETHRSFAYIGTPAQHIGIVLERGLKAIHGLACAFDGAVLRHIDIHQNFRAVGVRKELVLQHSGGKQ